MGGSSALRVLAFVALAASCTAQTTTGINGAAAGNAFQTPNPFLRGQTGQQQGVLLPNPNGGVLDQATPSEAGKVPLPKDWLKCVIDIETNKHTDPLVGSEDWWQKNYVVMEKIAARCSVQDSMNTLLLPSTQQTFSLPRYVALRFGKEGSMVIPTLYLPLMDGDSMNLPGVVAKFPALLSCFQIWTMVTLNLKACHLVNIAK